MVRRAISLLVLQAACSLSRFEDLRDRAWSDSNSGPVDSQRYPTAITPLNTGRPGVHIVVAGTNPAALATVSYSDDGDLDATGITIAGVSPTVLPILATVVDPEPGSPNHVAVGGLGTGTIQVYDARTGADGPVLLDTIDASACGGTGADLGREMIWTRTHLGASAVPDLVVVSGRDLIAFPDLAPGDSSPPCVRCSQAKDLGGLSAGHLSLSPEVRSELLVVQQDPAGVANAQVAFFRATAIELDDGGTCFASGSPSLLPGTSPDYGDLIVVGDLDANGFVELVASVRSTGTLQIHPDLTTSGPGGPPSEVVAATASASFGASLAIGDLDSDGRANLIVGDPGAMADGAVEKGAAFIFFAEPTGFVARGVLYDPADAPGQGFGHTVGVAPFRRGADETDLLVTGTEERLFVYFRALRNGTDPRP